MNWRANMSSCDEPIRLRAGGKRQMNGGTEMRMTAMMAVTAVCLLLSPTHAEGIRLGGALPVRVKLGKSTMPHWQGARLLEKHLERIAAQDVIPDRPDSQLKNPPENALEVHLGRTPWVEERFGKKLDAFTNSEGFIIETAEGRIVLAGKGEFGTLSAAVEFLRLYCGVEQYIPGEIGTVYSKGPPIVLPEIHYAFSPPCRQRLMYVHCRDKREARAGGEWKTMHHSRPAISYHHNLNRLLQQTEYARTHPEYFSKVDGHRRVFKKNVGSSWQPCMTNQEGIEVVANEVLKQFDADPELESVSIGVNDGGNYCECETCKPLWLEGEKFGQCARLYYQYANRIAEIVEKRHPHKVLGCLAYSSAGVPVDGTPAHRMVMPFVTLTSEQCVTDEIWTERIKEKVDRIARNTQQFGVYEYVHGAGTFIPYIFDRAIEKTLRYAYSRGCRAYYFETGMNWGLDVYKYAMVMRLVWDPETDLQAWKEKFFRDFYGPGAGEMKEFFEIAEAAWGRVPHDGVLHRREQQMELYTVDQVEASEKLLEEARLKAPDDVHAERILMTQRAFAGSAALIRRYWAGVAAQKALASVNGIKNAIEILSKVAGPENDYELIYRYGARSNLHISIPEPGEGSVRMEETYTEARTKSFLGVLERVVARAAKNKGGDPAAIALREVRELFAGVPSSTGTRLLMLDAAKFGGCVARLRRSAEAPVLDGILTDSAWKQAPVLDSFVSYGKGVPAKYSTAVRLLLGKDKLFLGFDCRQPTDSLYLAASGRDGKVWTDDSVEFFINRPGETDPDKLIQVIVNAEGTIFDRKGKDNHWDGPFEVAVSVVETGWFLELAIPLPVIREYIVDGTTRINVARNKQKTRIIRGVQHWAKYDEISSWFPSFKGNANLLCRGWLLLD